MKVIPKANPDLTAFPCKSLTAGGGNRPRKKTALPLGCINKSERGSQYPRISRDCSLQMCPPQVSRLCTRCDSLGAKGGAGGELRSTQLQLMRSSAQFGGTRWVHWGKGKKKKTCHFSFFLFEVTKLQGSGGNCCSDFILWEAGGGLPEAAAGGVICIACGLWF